MFSFSFCFLLIVQRDIKLLLFVTFKFRIHSFKITQEQCISLRNVPNKQYQGHNEQETHSTCNRYKQGIIHPKEKLLQLKAPVIHLCPFSCQYSRFQPLRRISSGLETFRINNSRKLCQYQIQTGLLSHLQFSRWFIKESFSKSDFFL